MKPRLFAFLIVAFSFVVGCTHVNISTIDIQSIQLELVERKVFDDGLQYQIKLSNGSNQVIVQNNVYLSYPHVIGNMQKSNEYKVEATGNRPNLEPGEEIILTVFTPYEGMGEREHLLIDEPVVLIQGYLEEVSEEQFFSISGPLRISEQQKMINSFSDES